MIPLQDTLSHDLTTNVTFHRKLSEGGISTSASCLLALGQLVNIRKSPVVSDIDPSISGPTEDLLKWCLPARFTDLSE